MKFKQLFSQLVKFGIVGIIAAVIDVSVLVLLTETLKLEVLISSGIAFFVSVVVNYILSMTFVFKGKGGSKTGEFIVFTLLSIGGFFINQFIMWLGVNVLSLYYLAVKIFAMIFVPVYNFVTRKIFLEKKDTRIRNQK